MATDLAMQLEDLNLVSLCYLISYVDLVSSLQVGDGLPALGYVSACTALPNNIYLYLYMCVYIYTHTYI